jgi:hypothetical protein
VLARVRCSRPCKSRLPPGGSRGALPAQPTPPAPAPLPRLVDAWEVVGHERVEAGVEVVQPAFHDPLGLGVTGECRGCLPTQLERKEGEPKE